MTGGKVLIVEDNPVNLRLAQFLLEKKGFTVRKAGSGAIVVALTAHAMAGDRERILAAGCDGYIPKPVDPQGLPGEVARYLEQGRLKTA